MKHILLLITLFLLMACKKDNCTSPTEQELSDYTITATSPAELAAYIESSDCVVGTYVEYCGTCGADVVMVGNAPQGVIHVYSLDNNLNEVYFAHMHTTFILLVE